ncbi:hypothetical protein DICVIV_04022 [Dictyocaulus viviparus]|uniref:Uncharacterized protein n=1 Tax=Dictyocaulus viviparus TaxID=29172 RepID=A0A0D8XYX2_DICVI|nr:hypothetical protein DICVIV_04022 [Dictyocaulus viviparus]
MIVYSMNVNTIHLLRQCPSDLTVTLVQCDDICDATPCATELSGTSFHYRFHGAHYLKEEKRRHDDHLQAAFLSVRHHTISHKVYQYKYEARDSINGSTVWY